MRLNMTGLNMVWIGALYTDELHRCIRLDCSAQCLRCGAVELVQHRVVNLRAEGILDRCQIGASGRLS
jgi:hypothetical protein